MVALVVVVGVGAAFAARLASLSSDLGSARDDIRAAADALAEGDLAGARSALESAQTTLIDTNATLYGAADVQVLGALPVLSQNLDALRETVEVALHLSAGGLQLLRAAEPLETPDGRLEVSLDDGGIPLDAVAAAQAELQSLAASLDVPRGFGDRSPLVYGPISDAQATMLAEVEDRRPQVQNLNAALTLIQEMLGGNGDRRYLVAVANSAEMRGSGGMYLSYGVLESSAGDLSLGAFGGIDDLFLTTGVDPASLRVPATELGRWQGLEPTRLWRNANLVPDFGVVAPRAMAMFEAATGLPVDGVIQIDPDGLAAILRGVGPVEVEQLGTVTAENVVDLTVNEAYFRFPDRDQRQDVVGDVAEAAFERLVEGDLPSLRPLAEAVADAVEQRHILFDSPNGAALGPIAFFRADGPLPDPDRLDHFVLTTQNRGRDKLDYYLDTSVAIAGTRPEGVAGELEVDVVLSNTAPAGLEEPEVVFGGDVPGEVETGTYTAIVSLYVPNGTTLLEAPPGSGARVVAEGDRTAITWDVAVAAGDQQSIRLRLGLPARPGGPYAVELVPIPRVRPTVVGVEVDDGQGGAARREAAPLTTPEVVTSGS